MPYRIDIACSPPNAVDVLIDLGALDIEPVEDGMAAIMPDGVPQDIVAGALGVSNVTVSAAVARDDHSVWLLSTQPVRIGNIEIASPKAATAPNALRLIDSTAFGTGHHPTTAL